MKRILIMLWLALVAPLAFAIPTSTSVTFGNVDPSTLLSTQFNKYDGSVYFKTSDGTAAGAVESVWHYSVANNKWVMVPKGITANAVDSVFGRTGAVSAQTGDYTWGQVSGKPIFAAVATSGSYTDLSDQPAIPSQYALTAGAGISVSGTYPNQTVSNTSLNTDAQVISSAGNTMSISGGNTAPIIRTNTVALTGQTLTSTVNGVATTAVLPVLTAKTLSANVSSTVVARSNITEWAIPVTAGKSYRVEVVAAYQTAALTTGGSLGFVLPTGAGTIRGLADGGIVNTPSAKTLHQPINVVNAVNTTSGSFFTTTGVGVVNSPHPMRVVAAFVCTTSGTLQLQWGSEVAASAAQINAGSTMYVTEF